MNDTQHAIGKLASPDSLPDAIHIAVAPMMAETKLYPGQPVGLVSRAPDIGGTPDFTEARKAIGLVDPFLKDPVFPEQWFWCFLLPNTISSLRHVWTHPAWEGVSPQEAEVEVRYKRAAENEIRKMAAEMGIRYDELLAHAKTWAEGGWKGTYPDTVVQQDSQTWQDNFDPGTFWPAYEILTGTKVEKEAKEQIFSCAC